MSPRNVLIVTYHFPPSAASGSFRLLGFARHLPRHGWRATVVAPPSLPWEPVDPALATRVPLETTVHHVPYMTNRLARRLAPYAGWLAPAARACDRAIREHRPEAVLTSGPPHQVHWLGFWLRKRHGLPWVADFRDPWYSEGRLERGRGVASWLIRAQEARVMAVADAVIANAPGACETLRASYPKYQDKFVSLPNGYDRESFATCDPPPPVAGRALRLVHTGAIYVKRDPRPVLDAVRALSDAGHADLEVAFYGPPPEYDLDLGAETRARDLGGRVDIAGQVPYARCLREMASADILLLMDSPGRTVGVPAKLYEYIGARRPVLALGELGGDLERVLAESGVPYRIAPPHDVPAITDALAVLAAAARAGVRARSGTAGHRFSREAIAGRLADLLERCAPRAAEQGTPGDDTTETVAGFASDDGHAQALAESVVVEGV